MSEMRQEIAINPEVRRQAIEWFVRLSSGTATGEDRCACENWLRQHPEHAAAWARLGSVRNALVQVPADIASVTLKAAAVSRRTLLKGVGSLVIVGSVGALAWREQTWVHYVADVRTGVGERRQVTLADGSTLTLNSDSAVDIVFNTSERRLLLRRGEILIESGHLPGEQRPLVVQTPEGSARALGTRFSLRRLPEHTQLDVFTHAVEVKAASSDTAVRVEAGQQLVFNRNGGEVPVGVSVGSDAWTRGQLIVSDKPLGEVIAEFARHRRGILRCSPEVTHIRVSGVFPLDNTDRALSMLAGRFPVAISSVSRYWVTVGPAS